MKNKTNEELGNFLKEAESHQWIAKEHEIEKANKNKLMIHIGIFSWSIFLIISSISSNILLLKVFGIGAMATIICSLGYMYAESEMKSND